MRDRLFRIVICLLIVLPFSFQGEIILDMTYGYEVKGRHDRMLDVAIQLNKFADVKFHKLAKIIDGFPFRT